MYPSIENDPTELFDVVMKDVDDQTPLPGTNYVASWYHPVTGYDAGYYSYLWSETIAHDLFDSFKKKSVFDVATGQKYREAILDPGATRGGIEMLRNFLGRDPCVDAFVKSLG